MTRSQFIAIVALGLAIVQDANAADMPIKAPAAAAIVAAAPSWAGWYAGIAGGGGWGQAEQSDASPFNSGKFDADGALIGGTLGYNWQAGAVVVGIESDLSYAAIKGSTVGTTDPCGAAYCATDIKVLGTVRGRLGLAWQNLLPYVTGGLAYANVHGDEGNGGPQAFGSGSNWIAGWTVGAGLEAKLAPNWSAKLEYLYADLDGKVFTDNVFGVLYSENVRIQTQLVRVGVNYRF